MSFHITSARSSRVTKNQKLSATSSLRRSTSSPARVGPRRRSNKIIQEESFDDDGKLDDTGVIVSLVTDLHFRDVPQFMEYIRNRMFSDIPQKAAGMNSTRIAEVLNYRAALPPIVTLAHIDALSSSSTKTEREVVELAHAGVLRRVTIPNRGIGASAVGDGAVIVSEWHRLVESNSTLDEAVKHKYISLMNSNPVASTISSTNFTSNELSSLTQTGFLTTSSASASATSLFARPGAASLGTLASLSSAGSKHAAGSLGAVGGAQASTHIAGGTHQRTTAGAQYNFSLPNTGSHIRLLIEARAHLLNLLKKSRYRETPMDTLRERWDGGIPVNNAQSKAKQARGEFTGVLPGRTKKWKAFYGLRFEWVVEECVGAGLVECFETGSVGVGVRML